MNTFPRRSPRFQQQNQDSSFSTSSIPSFGSSFATASSTSSTSQPSPTSDNLNIHNHPQQYPLQLQSQFLSPAQAFDAPLPSPSANDIDPFGRSQNQYIPYNMGGQTQNQNATSSYQGEKTQTQQSQQHHSSFSQPQRPNYPPTSVNGLPPGLPPDFLAEAAKRAQMACLMRDLGDVSL